MHDAGNEGAEVFLHVPQVLRRRGHDLRLADRAVVVHVVSVEQDAAGGLGDPRPPPGSGPYLGHRRIRGLVRIDRRADSSSATAVSTTRAAMEANRSRTAPPSTPSRVAARPATGVRRRRFRFSRASGPTMYDPPSLNRACSALECSTWTSSTVASNERASNDRPSVDARRPRSSGTRPS